MIAAEREEPPGERAVKIKMLKNDVRNRNVYENKQNNDNFTEAKGDICIHMTTFDRVMTCILLKPTVFCHGSTAGGRTARFKM